MTSEHAERRGPYGSLPREFGEVLDFENFIFRHNANRAPSMGKDYPHLYRESNHNNFRIIRQNGKIVCCVAIYPAHIAWDDAVLKAGGIGGVGTHPDARKQGLAGEVLTDCVNLMTDEDYDISILWPGPKDYYRKWGWEFSGLQWSFHLDRPTVPFLPTAPSGELLEDTTDPRLIRGVQSLHAAEKRGVVRDLELAEIMANILYKYRTVLLLDDDKPVAYVTYESGEKVWIEDYAGDPEAVLGLAKMLFGEAGARDMTIPTPAEERGVPKLLLERGIMAHVGYSGMILVINPQRVLSKYGVDDISVQAAGDGWSVEMNGDELQLSKAEMAKFLFGPERSPEWPAHDELPLPIHYGAIDHM